MAMEIKTFQKDDLEPLVGVVVGTRPGIVMFAPIIHALRKDGVPHFVIHTGQHYSPNMDAKFFEDLNLPQPDYRLEGVGEKKTHGGQTAAMLEGIEAVLMQCRPKLLLVGGDANTNLAGALAARKLHIQVGHVEAGERSYDWRMPEEHNRIIIDHISDHLFATGQLSIRNLEKEGIRGRIHLTGNPIVDASLQHFSMAEKKSEALAKFGLDPRRYALMTMHREENVDQRVNLQNGLQGVSMASQAINLPVVFLAHPRTLKRLREFDLYHWAETLPGIRLNPAVGYLDFLNLIGNSGLVFTDSGGVQQEACIHQVPCVTLRENTEWTETIEIGANRLAGCQPDAIVAAACEAANAAGSWPIPFGGGDAAAKIVAIAAEVIAE